MYKKYYTKMNSMHEISVADYLFFTSFLRYIIEKRIGTLIYKSLFKTFCISKLFYKNTTYLK